MAYQLEGISQEACTCEEGCPCWGYEANKDCGTVLSWHIDHGSIEDVDVSGRTVALVAGMSGIPCSSVVKQGAASATLYIDDETTPEQEEALLNTWTGKLGGPVGELTQLFGEVTNAGRAPIIFSTDGGKGTLKIGHEVKADTMPLWEAEWEAEGRAHTVHENVSSTADTISEWSEDPGSQEYSAVLVRFHFEA